MLTIILLKQDSFMWELYGSTVGGLLSWGLLASAILYFFIKKKQPVTWPLIILGICYFFISAFNFTGHVADFFAESIKYFVFIVTVRSLARDSNNVEMAILLLLGSISIIVNAVAFPDNYGRYAGFYVNPNTAGLIALLGYSLALTLKDIKFRLLFQFVCIIGGLMTLSRYFILLLLLITLISIVYNRYNAIGAVVGASALIFVITSGDFNLNSSRFHALKSIFSDDVDTTTITKESRDETWALYKDPILNNLLIGNGYQSFRGHEQDTLGIKVGVHNTYLMIIGEAGIIPLLISIYIYISLFARSIGHFFKHPEYLYLSLVLATFLLVSHNYFDNYIVLFFTLLLYDRLRPNADPEPLKT